MSSPGSHGSYLKRTLGLPAVLLFGLAYMAPLIVYGTYGVLAKASDDTASLAYLLALFAIVFTALSYGRLARNTGGGSWSGMSCSGSWSAKRTAR